MTMGTQLSRRQRQVLLFAQRYYQQHHYGPAFRDITAHLGLSPVSGAATYAITALDRKGYLIRYPGVRRGIVPVVLAWARVGGQGWQPVYPL